MNDFRLVYERTCPFTLVLRDPDLKVKLGRDTVDEREDLIVKLLVKGPDDNPAMVRIELLSQNDYSFMYEHQADFFDYKDMRDEQKLKPEYNEYLTILIKLFNQVIEQDKIEELIQKQINVSLSRSLRKKFDWSDV